MMESCWGNERANLMTTLLKTDEATIQPAPIKKRKYGFWWWLLLISVLIFLVFNSLFAVNQKEIGIIQHFDGSLRQVGTGLHLKIPLLDSGVKLKSGMQLAGDEFQVVSQEEMALTLKLSANWHIQASAATDFYKEFKTSKKFKDEILLPQLRGISTKLIGKYSVPSLLEQQETIVKQIYLHFDDILLTDSLQIDSVQIEQVILPTEYQRSVENMLIEKNLARTESLIADKNKTKLEAELANVEIEKAINKGRVDAEAYAIQRKAKAEAEAIRLKIQALQKNHVIVDYMRVNKWNGELAPGKDGSDTWKLPGEK